MVERLRGADALFLYMESPTVHLHIGFAGEFDAATMPEPYSFDRMVDHVATRLHLFPPFRKRLAPVAFGLHHPLWVDDEGFDLRYHVRRATLRNRREFEGFVGEVMSRPLDRAKPLWELWFIEGMQRGHFGVLAKAHHAIVDGVGGADMIVSLLDLEPAPPATETPAWKPETPPSGIEVFARGCGELALQPRRMAKATRRLAEDAVGTVRRARATEGGSGFTIGSPRTVFNTAIGPRRQVAFTNFALEDAKEIKRAFGATVNDVVLAVCGGALSDYLAERGEQVDATLTASVPVSVRTDEDKGTLGNRLAGVIVSLHTDVADPAERLKAIVGETAQAKELQSAISASIMTDWAEFATPLIAGRAFRFMTRTRIADRFAPIYTVTISNVPGPPFPLYLAGARLQSMNPIGPLMDGNALGITVASYAGQVFVGIIADPDALHDLDHVAAAIPRQINALLAAANAN